MLEKLKVLLKLVLIAIIILYALFQHTQGPVVAYVEFQPIFQHALKKNDGIISWFWYGINMVEGILSGFGPKFQNLFFY